MNNIILKKLSKKSVSLRNGVISSEPATDEEAVYVNIRQRGRTKAEPKSHHCSRIRAFWTVSKRCDRGIMLTEVLVVIPLLLIPLALIMPVGVRFYQTQVVDDTVLNLINTIRRSQTYGSFQKNDSSYGVKINDDNYVLFRGNTYASRVPADDEIFLLPVGVSGSGLQEVVFAKLSGLPSVTGTMTITIGTISRLITINEKGIVQ